MFCSDNDQPTLETTDNSPVEGSTNVTLTCKESISSIETVSSYEWYKDNSTVAINGESSSQYNIGNQRTAAGTYTCKVVSQNSGTSAKSNSQKIEFYCEYCFMFLESGMSLEMFYKL